MRMFKHLLPLFALALSLAAAEPPPCYDPAYFTAAKAETVRAEVAAKLPGLEAEIEKAHAEYRKLNANDKYFNDRMEKRFEIVGNLIRFIRQELAEPSTDAAMFARRGLYDLQAFTTYFGDEIAAYREANDPNNVKTVSVREFGAKGDGETDDTKAFADAIDALKKHPGRKILRIPAGTYSFADKASNQSHWFIENLENAEIAGEDGAMLLFADRDRRGIFMKGNRNVTVNNLALKYRQALFTQGIIESVDEKTQSFVFRKSDGYPDPRPKSSVCQACDPKTGTVINTASGKWIGSVEAQGNNRFRLTLSRAFQNPMTAGLRPGLLFVMPFRYADAKPIFLNESAYCTFRKIRIVNAPNLAFAPIWVTGVNLIECDIMPEKGAYLSANGDASHFGLNTANGIGPYLSHCRFVNTGDDSFNVYGMGSPVKDYDATSITLRWGFPHTLMMAVDPITGTIKWESECIKTEPVSGGRRLFCTDPVPSSLVSLAALKREPLTMQQVGERSIGILKVASDPDTLYICGISGTGTVITHCEFPSNRNNGMTIQSPNTLIDSCVISNMAVGIRIGGFLTWREGPPPYNLTVRNNIISNCWSMIESGYLTTGNRNAECRPIRSLTIENNRFEGGGNLVFDNVEGMVFRGNRLDGSGKIRLNNVGGVRMSDNTADGAPLPESRIVRQERNSR